MLKKRILAAFAVLTAAATLLLVSAAPADSNISAPLDIPGELLPKETADILKQSAEFTSQRKYTEAASLFSDQAFEISKKEFQANGGTQSQIRRADAIILDLKKQLREFKRIQNKLTAAKKNFRTTRSTQQAEKIFTQLAEIRNRIYNDGISLHSISAAGWPRNTAALILGISQINTSGLLGIVDHEFNTTIIEMQNAVFELCSKESQIISTAFSKENIFTNPDATDKAENSFTKIKSYTETIKELSSFSSKLNSKNVATKGVNIELQTSMQTASMLCDESKRLIKTIRLIQNDSSFTLHYPEDAIASIRADTDSYAAKLENSAKNFSTYINIGTALKNSDNLSILQTFSSEELSWIILTDSFKNACYEIETASTRNSILLWKKIADYYSKTGGLIYTEDFEKNNELKKYMEGTDGIYYPSRCIQELTQLQKNISKDKNALEGCMKKLNEAYIYRSNFQSQQKEISEYIKKLDDLQKDFNILDSDARQKLLSTRVARNEIDMHYNKALSSYKAKDLANAFRNWQKADETYSKYLEELKNDGDIQQETFNKLTKLRQDIIDSQKPLFVNETRAIKNNARTAYYAGDFNKALSYLSEADSKRADWSRLMDITLEEDEELERLKDFVNTAIAIQEGREISPYDSKAPEMNQNLSIASMYYRTAESYLATDKNSKEAKKFLNKAKEKINLVKIYYPRNKIASSLSLRIDKLTDPKAFETAFEQRYRELSAVNYASRSFMAQESYSQLLDLYELNPSYKGLKNTIYKAELDLGLKQKPVDTTALTKAKALAKEAKELYNKAGRDTILLQQAKEKAQAAIKLDPSNDTAITVLDEIALRTGEQSAVTLSAADEELYQKALADLQNNKVFDANSKITKLLQNKNNTRSAKILKLKKRIEASL